jgi:hypothetical protein
VNVNNHPTKDTLKKKMKFLSSVSPVELRHSVKNVGFDSFRRGEGSNFQHSF